MFKSLANWQGYAFPPLPAAPVPSGDSSLPANIFQNAAFEGGLNLQGAVFEGDADFSGARLNAQLNLQGAAFRGDAFFSCASFTGGVEFSHSDFGRRTDFTDSVFAGETAFRFADFAGPADFRGAAFADDVSFACTSFDRTCFFVDCTFEKHLDFAYASFSQGVKMQREIGTAAADRCRLPQAQQEACRVQRISLDAEGKKEAADRLFAREMRAKRQARTHGNSLAGELHSYASSWFERVFIDWTSEYGTNPQRLVWTAIALIVVFALIYHVGSALFPGGEIIDMHVQHQPVRGFGKMLYFSAQTFAVLGYGDLYPTGWMRIIAGVQSLIGGFVVALFVVIFAQKWRR